MKKAQIKENIFLVILGVIVLIFGLYFLSSFKIKTPANIGTVGESNERIKSTNIDVNQILGNLPPLGNPTAPVKIIEFADFHCPFCAQVPNTILTNIKPYIEQGLVAVYFRDFPLDAIHPFSRNVHLASRCANEQNKFWEFHDQVFSDFLSGMGQKTGDKDYLFSLAKKLSLDENKFKTCYETRKYEKEINNDYFQGVQLGIQGTPAFFVNNLFIAGLDPTSVFQAINIFLNKQK